MNLLAAGASRFATTNERISATTSFQKFDNDDDWREARRSGVGGSEISALLGCNPFETRESVLKSKLYHAERVATPAMLEGVKLEPLVVHEFAKTPEAQRFSRIERNKNLFRRRDLPFAIATPDAFLIVDDDKAFGILETKTAVRRWGPEKIAMATAQVQWYMFVTGADFAYLCCLEARTKLHIVPVLRDEEQIARMIEAATEFWNEFQTLKNGSH